jgi:O-antigen ligase
MKILRLLIILILVLFPFGELLRFDMGNNIVVKPLDVVVGAAIILALLRVRIFNVQSSIFKAVLIFTGIGLFSLLLNFTWLKPNEFLVSSFYLIRWVSYAALVPIILSFDEQFKKKLVFILFFDGLIIVLLGFLQYFFFQSLKSLYYLGWDEHMHRIFSVFFDPNFSGAFFVLFFLFLAGTVQVHLQKKEYKESKILGIILFVTLVAIFLTFSRGALLMLLAGSVTFLILINKKKLILLLLGVMVLFVAIASPKFYDENMNLFRMNSSKARIGSYATALRFIHDRPLLGVGFNSYRYAKESYGIRTGWTKAPSHADAGVDNSFLFVFVTTGIVGLLAYVWLLYLLVRRAYFLHKKKANILSIVFISSIVGLSVNALFVNSLFFPSIMLWVWMLVALMESKSL